MKPPTHPMRRWLLVLAAVAGIATCPTVTRAEPAGQTPATAPGHAAVSFDEMVQPGDRVLFVGDQITQQMFYTRAVATALIAMEPTHGLRFFNGGKADATAGSAVDWIDDLMVLTEPTVVFVMLGLNDGRAPGVDAKQFGDNLSTLLDHIRGYKQVREVLIVSPPAVASGLEDPMNIRGYNVTLHQLAMAAKQVAADKDMRYVDLYDPMIRLYLGAMRVEGPSVALGSELPGEEAHMVIASVLLKSLGVTPERLEPIGWSPLRPLGMRRIRDTLVIDVQPPTLEQAQASRAIYLAIMRHDEKIFRAWRLAPRKSMTRGQTALMAEADQIWSSIAAAALETYDE